MLDWITYIIITKNVCCIIFSNDFGMTSPSLDSSSNLLSFFCPNVLDILFPFDFLVESFNLFITDVSTIFKKIGQMTKMNFFSFWYQALHSPSYLCVSSPTSCLYSQEKFESQKLSIIHWFNEMRILDDQEKLSY